MGPRRLSQNRVFVPKGTGPLRGVPHCDHARGVADSLVLSASRGARSARHPPRHPARPIRQRPPRHRPFGRRSWDWAVRRSARKFPRSGAAPPAVVFAALAAAHARVLRRRDEPAAPPPSTAAASRASKAMAWHRIRRRALPAGRPSLRRRPGPVRPRLALPARRPAPALAAASEMLARWLLQAAAPQRSGADRASVERARPPRSPRAPCACRRRDCRPPSIRHSWRRGARPPRRLTAGWPRVGGRSCSARRTP